MSQNYASDDPSDAMTRNAVHRLWHQPLAEVDLDVVENASAEQPDPQAACLADRSAAVQKSGPWADPVRPGGAGQRSRRW
jgi:hypothetical protein